MSAITLPSWPRGQSQSTVQAWRNCEAVAEESPLEIQLNGESFSLAMRTPGMDGDLALGLLFAEGRLPQQPPYRPEIQSTKGVLGKPDKIHVTAPYVLPSLAQRAQTQNSACGMCGKLEWDPVAATLPNLPSDRRIPLLDETVRSAFLKLTEQQTLFQQTGGTHAVAAFNAVGELLASAEDVGRHNAADKVIGNLWRTLRLEEAVLLCVSGRVAYEIAVKAARAGISILASVSAPTSMAISVCDEWGIALAGFCRENRMTLYTYPERIIESSLSAIERNPL